MKKIVVLLSVLLCSYSFSQIKSFESDYVEMIKKGVQEDSRNIVAANLTLTEEQAKIFWPLYDEYDAAYDKLVNERVELIKEYMMEYYGNDAEVDKSLITRSIELKKKAVDLQEEYINKMMEVLPASLVGRFFQIDNRISALIDIVRMSNLPLAREGE
jgi:hypothetical protein